MARILIIYHSKTGNTRTMAEFVRKGAQEAGADVELKRVEDAQVDDLSTADGVILGSPTYYGHSSGPMRSFLDSSIKFHGKLGGKVGGAFASSANIGGGNETTVLDLLHALLIHGMVIEGTAKGDHYGPVSIGKPDGRVEKQCLALGARVARLAARLHDVP